jgi:hypothetical protein
VRRRWVVEQSVSCNQCGLDTRRWRRRPDYSSRVLVLSSRGCRGARAATNASGSSCPGAGSDLPLSLLLSARGVRGGSYGVYVHHVGEARTARTTKAPLPGAPNVLVVLRHFHRHCYESSPLWFFCWRGLRSLRC